MDDRPPREEARQEEEERPREPFFNLPPVILGLIGICVAVHLFRLYVLDTVQDSDFILRFAFVPVRYSGEYIIDIYALISPLTYSFIHGSYLHLGVNMIWMAAFGSPLASRIGVTRFLLFWALTALAAVLLHYLLHPLSVSPVVGASGAISGMMGAAARFGFQIDRASGKPAFSGPVLSIPQVLRSRTAVVFVVAWMLINLATGLGFATPGEVGQIAWEAHIGGFFAGFFGLFLFVRRSMPPVAPDGGDEEGTGSA